jgi:hypothetical protein
MQFQILDGAGLQQYCPVVVATLDNLIPTYPVLSLSTTLGKVLEDPYSRGGFWVFTAVEIKL